MQLTTLDADAAHLVDRILTCYLLLCHLPKLEPSPRVNGIFKDLVSLCCQICDEAVVAKVKSIHKASTALIQSANNKGIDQLQDCWHFNPPPAFML